MAIQIKKSILSNLQNFEKLSGDEIFNQRKTRFLKIGRDQGFKKPSDTISQKLGYSEPNVSKLIRLIKERKNLVLSSLIILGTLIILSVFL